MKIVNYFCRKVVITIIFLLLLVITIKAEIPIRNINPYSFLIGNSALSYQSDIYTINPASIGFLSSSKLFQDFSINQNFEKILFSQNLVIQELPANTFLFGYSLTQDDVINLKNSLFRFAYALNLADLLYLGVNLNYQDSDYSKFHETNLSTDLGLILSIKLNEIFKFINFGIYGLNANSQKVSLETPNTNGKYSALGFSTGWNLLKKLEMILSVDADLIREDSVSNDNKIVKYGIQFNSKGSIPQISLICSADALKNNLITYNAGVAVNFNIFRVLFEYKKEIDLKAEEQYLSFSFPIGNLAANNSEKDEMKKDVPQEEKNIKISYYEEGSKYKIVFEGINNKILYWILSINDDTGNAVKIIKSTDKLPDYILWDGNDNDGKKTPVGIYHLVLTTYEDKQIIETNKFEKKLYKGFIE